LWGHSVGRDETHVGTSDGEHKRKSAAGAGLAQGEVGEFRMDELLLNDEGIVTVALLGFLRRDGMASKVTTVGVIPIEKRCRQPPDLCTCIVFTTLDGLKSNQAHGGRTNKAQRIDKTSFVD